MKTPGPPCSLRSKQGAHIQAQHVHTTCWGMKASHKYLHHACGASASRETGLLCPQEGPDDAHTTDTTCTLYATATQTHIRGGSSSHSASPAPWQGEAGPPAPRSGSAGPGKAVCKDITLQEAEAGGYPDTAGEQGRVRYATSLSPTTLHVSGSPHSRGGQISLPYSTGAPLNAMGHFCIHRRCCRWREWVNASPG